MRLGEQSRRLGGENAYRFEYWECKECGHSDEVVTWTPVSTLKGCSSVVGAAALEHIEVYVLRDVRLTAAPK